MRKSVLIHIVRGGTEFKSTAVFIPYKVCSNNSVLCCIRSWTPPGRCSSTSPHVREYGFRNPGNFFYVESGIREDFACGIQNPGCDFEIRNTAQGIRNPTKDWNPESKFL